MRAWAAAPRPVVLRCGLPRPAELTPTSALLEVNGVRWLRWTTGCRDPVIVTYVAVDRPVYVVFTAPTEPGAGRSRRSPTSSGRRCAPPTVAVR